MWLKMKRKGENVGKIMSIIRGCYPKNGYTGDT